MNKQLLSSALLLFSVFVSTGQTLIASRDTNSALVDSSLLIEYFESGAPEFEWFYFATTTLSVTEFALNNMMKLPNLNDSSILRVQVDTEGVYIEISGLKNLESDIINLRDLKLIDNQLSQTRSTWISYFKYPEQRDSLRPLPTKVRIKRIQKPHDSDTIKTYSLLINDTVVTVHLQRENESIKTYHFSGNKYPIWFKIRSKILGREPKRYIGYGGSVFKNTEIWKGELKL